MIRISVLFICLFLSNHLAAIEAELKFDEVYGPEGNVFNLSVKMAHDGDVEFSMYYQNGAYFLRTKRTLYEYDEVKKVLNERSTIDKSDLTLRDAKLILIKLNAALNYNTLDYEMGRDGSDWCIESFRGGAYTKACFWYPGLNAGERKLSGLVQFGSYLWQGSNLNDGNLELY